MWIATPEDGIACLKLVSKAMRRWRTQLDERLIEALPHIKKLVHKPVPAGKDEGEVVYGVTANKLAKKMRISDQTARNYLNTMAERGVLTYTQPKGRLKVCEFIVPEEEIEKRLEVTSVEPIEISLASEFEKETEEFVRYPPVTISYNTPKGTYHTQVTQVQRNGRKCLEMKGRSNHKELLHRGLRPLLFLFQIIKIFS